MTVQAMLRNMTQEELCHWIAFHKIDREQYAEKLHNAKQEEQQKEPERPTVKINDRKEASQTQRDAFMTQQLLALVGMGKRKRN